MAKTSLKRMRTFIEMYDKQDVLTVRKCSDDEPGDRYLLGQVAVKGYQVDHKVGEDDYIYLCKTLTAAAECVNDIIFDLPMGDRATPAK
tara:strand:+ start:643 stop:909 length:267 start_codon:yes stop_codon:yes gene_type:complete